MVQRRDKKGLLASNQELAACEKPVYYLGGLTGEAFPTSLHLLSVFTPAPPSSISFGPFSPSLRLGSLFKYKLTLAQLTSPLLPYERPSSPLSPFSKSPGLSAELQSRTKVVILTALLVHFIRVISAMFKKDYLFFS